jgi:hypothetical protein
MAIDTDPIVGNWYQHVENGQKFEVVEIDEDRGVVEVQYVDGEVDELDMDEWYELELEASDQPDEDWEEEDLSVAEAEPEAWVRPKRGAKRQTDDFEEEDDDWEEDDADDDVWEEE